MVILEVLTGQPPFPRHKEFAVMRRVIEGERPGRPQGTKGIWFTDDLWGTLEQCWLPKPKDRPTVEAILEHLAQVPARQPLPPSAPDNGVKADSDGELTLTMNGPGMLSHSIASPGLTLKLQGLGCHLLDCWLPVLM